MRLLITTVAAVAALVVPSVVSAQGTLTITNYQVVSEERSSRSEWFVTYRADVVNTGALRTGLTATVSTLTPATLKVVAGQNVLHFGNVPTGAPVTSIDTFTVLEDRTVPRDFANLQWVFLSPTANPGPNQTVNVGVTVNLNGSGSTNISGSGGLTYSWSFASKPATSAAVLANANTAVPTFKADVAGNYVVTLTVTNGIASDSASVKISTKNSPPLANAGPNQSGSLGIITLDGSGSSDVDGDSLTYFWTMISKPAASNAFITNFRSVSPGFVMDVLGTYVVKLVVNDGKVDSDPSTVTISSGNTRPVAKAEASPATANLGTSIQLSGAKSTDVDGDPLTYKWSLTSAPAGSTASISNNLIVNPTFTPDKPGSYVAQLIVNDGKMDSDPSTVTVAISSTIQAPTANAGANQSLVARGATITLNGSGVDPQNLPLTYLWSLIAKPAGSTAGLSSTTAQKPTFVADLPGDYIAQLIVNNGTTSSAPATVTITNRNTRPVANAGVNQSVLTGVTVSLDGIGSTDADGDPLTYSWTLTTKPSGSTSSLSAASSRTPTFFADVAGTYIVQLIVNDGFINGDPTTVTITVAPKNISFTPGSISLLSVPGVTGTLTISLTSPAPAGGLTLNLTGFDTSVISLSTTQVTLAGGSSSATIVVTPLSSGTTNILASGGSYQPGSVTVTVTTPSITIALVTPGVKTTYSVNGTVTLSSPAPASGVNVALSVAPSGLVSFNPPTVNIAAGSSTASFSITGVTEGTGTITASSTGFASGTTSIVVSSPGNIGLAPGVAVAPGQSISIPVTLSAAAPSGGVTINLTSSDPTKATVTPSVIIAAGQTTPATQPQVTGVAFGSATILASGGGYKSDSQTVTVGGAALGFGPTGGLTLIGSTQQNLSLTLSAPAPAAGLVVDLSANPVGIISLPATATFAAGATTTSFPVTGVAVGTTTITASSAVPGITAASTPVSVQNIGVITLANTNVALGQSVPFPITLSAPAPIGGTTVTLSSSNSRVSISPASVTIAAGATSPAASPQITGSAPGTATVTASAAFYTQATQAANVTATISLAPASITLNGAETKNLTLTLSGPAPPGGLTVNISSSSTATATVPATVTIAANATTVTVPVTGVNAGATTIRAGFGGLTDATAVITVVPAIDIIVPATTSVNPGDSIPYNVTLASPAPAPNGLLVNLVISDTAKANLTLTSIFFNAGQTTPTRQPSLNGISVGTLTITASATGKASAVTQVTVGAVMTLSPSPLQITGADGSMTLTLSSAAASNLSVTLNSSNPGAATVPASLIIPAGATSGSFKVTAVGLGTTTVTATASGYPAATASAVVSNFLAITNSSLPGGMVNTAYSATMLATGGTAPYSWSATGLPAGLSITPAGVVSGTPSSNDTFQVVVTVTDSSTPAVSKSKTLSLKIDPQDIVITTTSLPDGQQGVAYTKTLSATGGPADYRWYATGLPAGLNIAPFTGVISGAATVNGTFQAVHKYR